MYTSIIISSLAVIVSIVSFFRTQINLKKQLRLSKLEEILEILQFIRGNYSIQHNMFIEVKVKKHCDDNNEEYPPTLNGYNERKGRFMETYSKESIIHKISRLKVLSNAYLKNSIKDLKFRIYTIGDLYYQMFVFIKNGGIGATIQEDGIIPDKNQIEKFIIQIEHDIIKEMKLGYTSIKKGGLENYKKTQFQRDIENLR